jgi:magnesium transporter
MVKFLPLISRKRGLPPGAVVYVGEDRDRAARIKFLEYDEEHITEKEIESLEECLPFKDSPTVTWINMDGVHDTSVVEKIGGCLELHPLVMEDIVSTAQRPKVEDHEEYLFVVMKMLQIDKEGDVSAEQISFVLGSNFVISFQEKEGDVFDPLRDRIRKAKGRIRKLGPDYLLHSLIDAVVDNYFVILEEIGRRIERLEDELLESPTHKTSHAIHDLKRDLIYIRRSVWPLREVIGAMTKGDLPQLRDATAIYFKDVHDHTIQIIDTTESFRDMVSGMLDVYLSVISNRMNEVMKILTIFASIFIPLTFVAGVYGMNFKNMPEIYWHYGYYFALGIMAVTALGLLGFFKYKKWL